MGAVGVYYSFSVRWLISTTVSGGEQGVSSCAEIILQVFKDIWIIQPPAWKIFGVQTILLFLSTAQKRLSVLNQQWIIPQMLHSEQVLLMVADISIRWSFPLHQRVTKNRQSLDLKTAILSVWLVPGNHCQVRCVHRYFETLWME